MSNKKILITGCPRGATKYMSKFLKECDRDVPHERLAGEDGLISWLLTPTIPAGSSFRQYKNFKVIRTEDKKHMMKRPFHSDCSVPTVEFKSEFDSCIHQIREPRKCIYSMSTLRVQSIFWTTGFIDYPEQGDMSNSQYRLRQQMYFWYYWNKIGIENSDWYYCVENLGRDDIRDRFCSEFDLTESVFDHALKKSSKKTNKRRSHLGSWDRLREIDEEMYFKIDEFGKILGYDCD
jgi:hypothetical protein